MTEYIIELYEKRGRVPYQRFKATLPDGARPTFTNSKECFDYKLSYTPRVKIRYASNGQLVAVKYIDVNGNGRLRWKKF